MRSVFKAIPFALVALTLSTASHAAPQLLGIIATATPVKLHCDGDTCRTELSTICMQVHRDTPERHQPYQAYDLNVFSVVTKTQAGETVHIALDQASFRAERGYTATSIEFSMDTLKARGLTPIALSVTKGGVLIPTAVAGDPNPIMDGEAEQVFASLQPVADKVFKKHSTDFAAIQIVNRLMSETPDRGRMAKADRENLWSNTFGENARESSSVGMRRAADTYGYCQYRTKQGKFFSVRRCLEQRLDGMLMNINTDYWKATQPGS